MKDHFLVTGANMVEAKLRRQVALERWVTTMGILSRRFVNIDARTGRRFAEKDLLRKENAERRR